MGGSRIPHRNIDLGTLFCRSRGNMTGVYLFTTGLETKRLVLLHEMVPKATTIAVLVNPNFSTVENYVARRARGSGPPRPGEACGRKKRSATHLPEVQS
jgi:hypothetical protein